MTEPEKNQPDLSHKAVALRYDKEKENAPRIVAKGSIAEHYLNGVKVLHYERGGEEFRAAVAKSKFKDIEKFGEAPQGHILLQDHGGGIAFRNIKIRALKN